MAITITSPATASGTVGSQFSYQIAATGGTVTGYSATGMPPGTTLNAATGLISGVASDAGSYTMVVSVQPGPVSQNVAVTIAPNKTAAVFPAFVPVFPPPNLGSGTPAYPPGIWRPPPLPSFSVPAMVNPAAVPPSVAGQVQPFFKSGSATSPPANGYFPEFTTTFPNPPVTVQTTPPPPAMITTTPPITIDGLGPYAAGYGNGGSGAQSLHHGDATISQRRAGAVFQPADDDELREPRPPKNSSGKRVPPRPPTRNHH